MPTRSEPPTADVDALVATLGEDAVARPGADAYEAATSPKNMLPEQRPAAVLTPGTGQQLADGVAAAGRAGARIAVQATGHGTARAVGSDTVLVSTAGLAGISIDARAGTATVGAGAVWSDIQQAAERDGMLGCSGTAPDVGVAGYTFAGGVGWLTRPHGMASGRLRSVRYVDGAGRMRTASADAPDETDREALWAFRGGSPPGIAAELTFELVAVPSLAAGYALWPADRADALIAAWARTLGSLSAAVTSTIALLSLPPEGPFPDDLLGHPVVHLACAAPDGETEVRALRNALAAVAPPADDTIGPCDARRLATIHLDPPVAVPARGTGRWLTAEAANHAAALLRSAGIGEEGGLMMAELRHLATDAPAADGAMTTPPGPFLLHAVGDAPDAEGLAAADAALVRVRETAAPVDLGRAMPSFCDGAATVADGFGAEEAQRLRAIGHALDPDGRLRFEHAPPPSAQA